MKGKRRAHSDKFKAKIAIEALKGIKTLAKLATEHKIHPNQISTWKKQLHSKFTEFHYSLDDVTKNHIIPTIFTTNLPSDLNQQPVDEKISTFIRLMLPKLTSTSI